MKCSKSLLSYSFIGCYLESARLCIMQRTMLALATPQMYPFFSLSLCADVGLAHGQPGARVCGAQRVRGRVPVPLGWAPVREPGGGCNLRGGWHCARLAGGHPHLSGRVRPLHLGRLAVLGLLHGPQVRLYLDISRFQTPQ